MRECCLEHNHCIGPSLSEHYPSNRKLSKEESVAVNELLNLQPKTKYVKEMIASKFGKFVTPKDIHNSN